ncbi:MAG: fused MFS/spermidine synthase [Longimicrobiales bacterium]
MSTPQQARLQSSLPSAPGAGLRITVLTLFFLSGACGLVYEVVWMRMLTLVFGATAFATSTILASFFSGLALGSFSFGRVIDRGGNPLKTYALLEVGIGLFAFLMPVFFAGLNDFYVQAYRQFDLGFASLSFIRFVLSFLVLLIPATLMGGTLPVMVKYFVRRPERLGSNVGALYALNTFGAVVGTVAAGFFLILFLGVREAAYLAGAVNLLIALVVWVLYRRSVRVSDERPVPVEDVIPAETRASDTVSPRLARLVLWAVGISGFCSLALEVFWTRALVFFLDNSTHAFTTILTAFLLGIALGSSVFARFVDTRKRLLGWLGGLEILIGISAILAIPILNHSTPVIERLMGVSVDAALPWKWMGMRLFTTLSVILVPTVLIGATFPLATKIYAINLQRVGTALGNVYSVNTVGGVFGSLLAGFLLIPTIGMQNGIILVSAINVGVGMVLLFADPGLSPRIRTLTATVSGAVFGGLALFYLTTGALQLTSYTERVEAEEVLFYEEGIGATVKVFANQDGERLVSINGFPVAGEPLGLQDAQKPLAHLPLLLVETESPRVNLVGFGAGGASWGVMQYDVAAVDCVELVPAVIRAARYFPTVNHGVVDMPGYNVILGDGRNYAAITDERYDVISIDATSPKMAGNGSLYALDFYQLLERNLNEGGIVVQWFPLHLLSDREARMTTRTFMEVFDHTSLWLTPLRQHAILVGTLEPLNIDFQRLERRMDEVGFREEFQELHVIDAIDLLSWFVMGNEHLEEYVGETRINSDNHPYLEFSPAFAYFVADLYKADNMEVMRQHRESVAPYLTNPGETEGEGEEVLERIRKRYEATQHSMRGDVLLTLGREDDAMVEYNLARMIDPTDKNWLHPVWNQQRPDR